MKVLKKISVLFVLGLMFVFSSCNNLNSEGDHDSSIDNNADMNEYNNRVVPIYDINNKEIGSITCLSYSAFVAGNILYKKLPENASSKSTIEYWLYDINTKTDYQLAVVDDCSYVAAYEAIESNNHLYLSISSGEFAEPDSKLTIYDIDLLKHSMLPILEIEGGLPYNSYTIANNKLILAELLYNGTTDLVEIDLKEKRTSPVVHEYNENDCFTQNSIRHIYADKKNIYAVCLVNDGDNNYSLQLDIYDFDYNLLNTINLGDFCISTYLKRTEDTKVNEWKQFIAYFFVHNDLIYYQNFSTTTAIGWIEEKNVNRLFDTNALFSYVYDFSQISDDDLFIQSNGDDTQNRNIFYLVNSQTHEVKTAEFYADNHDYTFWAALRNGNNILLKMDYLSSHTGERLPERLYYIDMNDLEFKPME